MNQIDTGKFIAGCRKEKGLTQAQLAEKPSITDRAVSKWETGKCMPDSSIMLELCRILDVSVNELLSGEKRYFDFHGFHQYFYYTVYVQTKYSDKSQGSILYRSDHVNYDTYFSVDDFPVISSP